MKRLFTGLLASAFLLGAAFATSPIALANHSSSSSSSSSSSNSKSTHSCPAGEHYVHGYTDKNGKKVKGYCRKGSTGK